MDKETVSGELLQAEISEPCAYGVADCFCILFYFESLRGGEKQTLDPVDRCVGAEPGAIYAVDMSLELLEVGSGGHFPSFNVLSPPIASQTYKLTLRRALWMS